MMQDEWIDIPSIEETPIPTMEIKNSGGSFADSMAPYLVRQESSGNPYAVSNAGAQGLWQIMPNTGREMASKLGMQNFDPFNPQHSEMVGKAYLNQMYDTFQDPQLALAAYNAGPGRVQQAIQRAGTNDPSAVLQFLPSETQNYVPKILGNAQKESAYAAPNAQDEWIDIPSIEEQPAERPPYVPSANVEQTTEQSAPMSTMDYANNLGAQAVNSFGFNLLDNYANQYKKLPDVVQNTVEALPLVGGWAKYLKSPELESKNLANFEKENPKASLAAQLAGALTMPAPTSLGKTIGTSVLYGGGKRIDNADPTTARGIAELGIGAGEDALIGGGAYGASKLVGGVINALKGDKLSAGEKQLARRLRGVSDETLGNTKTALQETTQPVFLPEALQTEDLFNQARTIANSADTKDIAQAILKARDEGKIGRLNTILDDVAPLKSPGEAGAQLKESSEKLAKSLKDERDKISKLTYGPIYKQTPVLSDEILQNALRTPKQQSAFNTLKNSIEFIDKPENSTELLHAVKSELQAKAQEAMNSGKGSLSRRLGKEADHIRDILNKNVPGLPEADKLYTQMSKGIEDVTGDSLLGMAMNTKDLNVGNLGSKILSSKTDIKEVKKLINDLGPDGESVVLQAMRAKLSDDIANRVGGKGVTNIFDKDAVKQRLTDILGESKAANVLSKLEDEITIAEGATKYKIGSATQPAQQGQELEDFIRDPLKYYGRRPSAFAGDALSFILGRLVNPSTKSLQDEARIIFSKDKATEALSNILAKRNSAAKSKEITDLLSLILTRGGQDSMDALQGELQ